MKDLICSNCNKEVANRGIGNTKTVCSKCWNSMFEEKNLSDLETIQFLKEKILEVENSRSNNSNPNDRIVTIHLDPDFFLKLAYFYVGNKI